MHTMKEKMSNVGSAAKEKAQVYKANVEEKVEKTTARSKGEKELAHEKKKMKEAEAKMQLHAEKAEHKAEKLDAQHAHLHGHHTAYGHHGPGLGGTHGHHEPTLAGTHGLGHHHGTGTVPTTGTGGGAPTNPVTGLPSGGKYL